MKSQVAVFVTDAINRHNAMIPLGAIVESMEGPLATAIADGIAFGMPGNVDHDLCRPIGWSEPRGVHIAKDMARQLGIMHLPETDEEKARVSALRQAFVMQQQKRQIEPHLETLNARIEDHATDAVRFWRVEAAAAIQPGIAAAIYPEFFRAGEPHVDKDGLVDFRSLLSQTRQVHPGVFHDPERDLLLFAHRFFRRSLSLRNSLNAYILQSFNDAAALKSVDARLRLDPDMVGHPESASPIMELEYWHGPKYDDDIACIPSGVAEHKSRPGERDFSGIDKTQIWWKDPETRLDADLGERRFRTFEIEELIEDESPGLADGVYGCRYAHAEYDLTSRTVSHFDGAIRAYSGEAYLRRIEQRIDRAGKQAEYTKLFRLDGDLPVPLWKRVLSDWYRSNRLVPEYLGASAAEITASRPAAPTAAEPAIPALAAFLCLEKAQEPPPTRVRILADQQIDCHGELVPVAEIGQGKICDVVRQWLEPGTDTIAARSSNATIGCIELPGDPPQPEAWTEAAKAMAEAIVADANDRELSRIAVAFGWTRARIATFLSIEGQALLVAQSLLDAATLVQPHEPASTWIETFRDALVRRAPDLTGPVLWPADAARSGRLAVERKDDLDFQLMRHRPQTQSVGSSGR